MLCSTKDKVVSTYIGISRLASFLLFLLVVDGRSGSSLLSLCRFIVAVVEVVVIVVVASFVRLCFSSAHSAIGVVARCLRIVGRRKRLLAVRFVVVRGIAVIIVARRLVLILIVVAPSVALSTIFRTKTKIINGK